MIDTPTAQAMQKEKLLQRIREKSNPLFIKGDFAIVNGIPAFGNDTVAIRLKGQLVEVIEHYHTPNYVKIRTKEGGEHYMNRVQLEVV